MPPAKDTRTGKSQTQVQISLLRVGKEVRRGPGRTAKKKHQVMLGGIHAASLFIPILQNRRLRLGEVKRPHELVSSRAGRETRGINRNNCHLLSTFDEKGEIPCALCMLTFSFLGGYFLSKEVKLFN